MTSQSEVDKIDYALPRGAADTQKPKELQRGDCNGTFNNLGIPPQVNTNGSEHLVNGKALGS